MMNNNRLKLPIWMGALVGGLFTPLLIAVFFLGERFSGLPFVPFDFFNWIARILPGGLLTFGIDTMVDTLIAFGLGENLDAAAKTSEQLIGLATFWMIGIVAGALFFALLNRTRLAATHALSGPLFGLAIGLPFTFITLNYNVSATAPPVVQLAWLALVYTGYGVAHSWVYGELSAVQSNKTKHADGDASAGDVQGIDRRSFLVKIGGASATLTVIGAGLGALLTGEDSAPVRSTIALSDGGMPMDGAGNMLPNSYDSLVAAPGTRAEYTPVPDYYRIDILSGGLPSIPADYTLPIFGLVANEVNWSLDDIRALPSQSEFATMGCISNRIAGSLISTTKWTGVSFQTILNELQPDESAVALKIMGADNFDEYISLDLIREDERIMLAYDFNDAPLPLRNGFPLRVYIPDRYGMKQPKWITSIEFVAIHEPGYWVRRGWSKEAIVNTTSVIDTVATDSVYSDDSGQMLVPMGGMAWAGARGIARVEVRIDEGEWQEAQLRTPLSDLTWVIWRYDWPFQEGSHRFEVRCIELATTAQGDAIVQTAEKRSTRPDGATGLHSINRVISNQTEA